MLDQIKEEIKYIRKTFETIRGCLDIDQLGQKLSALMKETEAEGFYDNKKNAKAVFIQIADAKMIVVSYFEILENADFFEALIAAVDKGEEKLTENLEQELHRDVLRIKSLADTLQVTIMLNDKWDTNNAIISINAGAGGTESQDWADMLLRMYTRFFEKQKWKFEILEKEDGAEAGIKNATIKVSGSFAYGYMKAEKGVHRLVRISPFDSNKRRHTSFASVEVTPEITEEITLVIDEKDLRIDAFRSSGAGGQHVNKTDSACRITHIPTGIVVTCQNGRSLIQNREEAMQVLKSKLMVIEEEKRREEMSKIKGEQKKNEWGSQIRNYVFCPYTLVKDARTGHEETNVQRVMDGDIMPFIKSYLISK
ncbi:MAG: peptide chain release factor 2 [Firmicutes bacterium]|nr:peptide chain release factor 2 [Bacillota bacterium]